MPTASQTRPSRDDMNDIQNRRYTEQLNKEKEMRRAWRLHDSQNQVMDPGSPGAHDLELCRDTLKELTADPVRTTTEGLEGRPSRRKQLVALRNQLRKTIDSVDQKIEEEKTAVYDDPARAYAEVRARAARRTRAPAERRPTQREPPRPPRAGRGGEEAGAAAAPARLARALMTRCR